MKVLCTLPMTDAATCQLSGKAEVIVLRDQSDAGCREAVANADYLVVRSQLPDDIFDHAPRLRGVVRHGTGLDMIPVEAATRLGIPVANVPGVNAQAVAEYYVAGMLAFARPLARMETILRGQGWNAGRALAPSATELSGKTLGIVGVGTIGRRLAQACACGFGMRVLGMQRPGATLPDAVQPSSLADLLAHSDYVALCCPLTSATRGMIGAAQLRSMKPDAVLLNAARGAVVDEPALITALQEKWIRGAALDVYARQPLQPDHPFFQLDNVMLTPHVGGMTAESSSAMSAGTVRQLLQMMAGERPEHLVNPQAWPGRRAAQGGRE
ncbi:NAD(P)-dependent oxidoreductase [Pollutimonas bauzanensis]|uniref:D-3-phosphoglycerate dehydrogenase n=1 Tax=Pollutimonas bauzanensis TaxID=658167 RepID=A0A1M5VIB4_9BURK|nr:NAD(P)-dependent oxidoreductase [Pollutimonas bauzanensis]SHH74999.1 D-3-phosphoglycerate dehydrogenase [Pollutimonas bauzanensis]